jgi:enamine deaminase RidA (YjgF/YER057c/UK114 family)
MSSVQDRLLELEINMPPVPAPVAAYVPGVRTGDLVFVSGQIPMVGGELVARGPVPSQTSIKEAQACARQCVLNGLAVVSSMIDGDLDRVVRIVRLGVFVASDQGFNSQPEVANGASHLLQDIFGERGQHARAAVGSIGLPLNAPVEVEMVVQVD